MGRLIGSILFAFAGLIAIRGIVQAVTPDASVASSSSSASETFTAEPFVNSEELVAQAQTTPTGVQGAGRGLQRQDVVGTPNSNEQAPDTPSTIEEPVNEPDPTPAPQENNPPVSALW